MRKPKIQHKSTSISRSQAQPACRLPPVNPIRLPGLYNSDRANQPQAAAPVHPPQQRSPEPARRDPDPNPEHPNPGAAEETEGGTARGGSSPGRADDEIDELVHRWREREDGDWGFGQASKLALRSDRFRFPPPPSASPPPAGFLIAWERGCGVVARVPCVCVAAFPFSGLGLVRRRQRLGRESRKGKRMAVFTPETLCSSILTVMYTS